ncbi:hypothetical protein LPJ55_003960 [Coemansia sp. RSA 990]|nr:hypothetical protein BX667DRAFT_495432 [Coemansia mojavensis]KAJ1871318.1 hypothetical protein LPJ55_003960 [Coemansia sp. RSA 990]
MSTTIEIGTCGESVYYWREGKQIIVKNSPEIDLDSVSLDADITHIKDGTITYKDRFNNDNTEPCVGLESMPKIEYNLEVCGVWSDLMPVGLDKKKNRASKIATWKTKQIIKEARLLGMLDNENIVKIKEVILWKGRFTGFTMENLVEIREPEQVKDKLPKFLTTTVEYIHSKGIFHCDIRMNNIMMDRNQRLKLIDFDIAQTEIAVPIRTFIDEALAVLKITPRLDILDVMMSVMLIYEEKEVDLAAQKYMSGKFRTSYFDRCVTKIISTQ